MSETAEKEWQSFREERTAGIEEIKALRQRVAEEEARKKKDKEITKDEEAEDKDMTVEGDTRPTRPKTDPEPTAPAPSTEMDVDDGPAKESKETSGDSERKEDSVPMLADDDDAVEY